MDLSLVLSGSLVESLPLCLCFWLSVKIIFVAIIQNYAILLQNVKIHHLLSRKKLIPRCDPKKIARIALRVNSAFYPALIGIWAEMKEEGVTMLCLLGRL